MSLFADVFDLAVGAIGRVPPPNPRGSFGTSLLDAIAGRRPAAGVRVDPQVALTYSAVWRAVNFVSDMLACVPWHTLERVSARERREVSDHPLETLLNLQANPEMDAFTFRKLAIATLLLRGNTFAEIVRDASGTPRELWPIDPAQVRLARTRGGALYYEVQSPDTGRPVELALDEMWHPRGLSPNGLWGHGPIALARESISMGLAAEAHGAAFFGNDARPAFALKHPGSLGEQAKQNLERSLAARHGGARRSWLPMVLEEGMDIHTISLPNRDSQWLESRQHQVTEIARWFGLPPHKLMDLSRATFSNIESQEREVVKEALMPWAKACESQADWKLLSVRERSGSPRLYTKFNLNAMIRGDMQGRARFYEVMWRIGAYSIDEVRAFEDMNPVPLGETRFVMLNMQTLERAAAGPPAAAPGSPGGGPGEDGEEDPADDEAAARSRADEAAAAQFDVVLDALGRMLRLEANAVTRRWGAKGWEEWPAWLARFHGEHAARLVDALTPVAEALAALVGRVDGRARARAFVEAWVPKHLERQSAVLEQGAAGYDVDAQAVDEARDFTESLVEDLLA